MRHGIVVMNLGDFADPRTVVRLGRLAESSGWDGLFLWDHLGFVWDGPSADAWTTLAMAAATTERLILGTAVSPVARYRPHVLANALATLDVGSGGRVILGVGLGGVAREFGAFGEPEELRVRAAMTDEALDVIARLWAGEKVTHEGRHFTVRDITLAPLPVQRPRIPIWIGGMSEAALRRAARWDGWLASTATQQLTMSHDPAALAAVVERLQLHRREAGRTSKPFDVVVGGYTAPNERMLVAEYAAAGATWWLESLHGMRGTTEELFARVAAGGAR